MLDFGRDDYYGHGGTWTDIRQSTFLERLDSPDRTPPTPPTAIRVGDDPSGLVRFTWGASTDDVGPVAYRIYEDGKFVRQVATTSVLAARPGHDGALRGSRRRPRRPPQRPGRRRGSAPTPAWSTSAAA